MSKERNLVIDNKDYSFIVGKGSVIIRSPKSTKKHIVPFSTFKGWTPNDVERAQNKGYFSIKPREVVDYIKKNDL